MGERIKSIEITNNKLKILDPGYYVQEDKTTVLPGFSQNNIRKFLIQACEVNANESIYIKNDELIPFLTAAVITIEETVNEGVVKTKKINGELEIVSENVNILKNYVKELSERVDTIKKNEITELVNKIQTGFNINELYEDAPKKEDIEKINNRVDNLTALQGEYIADSDAIHAEISKIRNDISIIDERTERNHIEISKIQSSMDKIKDDNILMQKKYEDNIEGLNNLITELNKNILMVGEKLNSIAKDKNARYEELSTRIEDINKRINTNNLRMPNINGNQSYFSLSRSSWD